MTVAPDLLRVDAVGLVFRGGWGKPPYVALADIALAVAPGEFLCLLGPSGCGKSTLLNILAGFERPTSGRVLLRGAEIRRPGRDRVMIFQDANMALFPWLTARENVEFGLRLRGDGRGAYRRVADRYLAMVGLGPDGGKFPHELSGGMKQRVQIARALAIEPDILLMDEPFGALDAITRQHLHGELLALWEATGKTIVFVTHDIGEAVVLADRVAVMSPGPGARITRVFDVDLPRPRNPRDGDVGDTLDRIQEHIRSGEGTSRRGVALS